MNQTSKHLVFSGRVQGVGFRYTANSIARRHELTGFVRNLPNGTVEMLAQGRAKAVDACVEDIEEYFAGYITDVKANEAPVDPQYTDFRITF